MDFFTVSPEFKFQMILSRDKQGEVLHMLPSLNHTNFGKFFVIVAKIPATSCLFCFVFEIGFLYIFLVVLELAL